jgi:hypothetical protein
MKNESFLDKIAQVVIQKHSGNLNRTIIILPNKRAKIFLVESLKKQINETTFLPKIISIEHFIEEIAGVRNIDAIELMFEFYEVYLNITKKNKQQSYEIFSNWAKTLLQDFNEIDRYLLNPTHVLSYLKDIEDIKKWGVTVENKTTLLENYIDFWKLLPKYYQALYQHLLKKGLGYQGLVYREAEKKHRTFAEANKENHFIFAGFNALNAAEENIIQYLVSIDHAEVYWDADQTFLNDPFHDAGLFLRKQKSNWKYYKSNPFQWIFDDFSKSKKIEIIGTPKSVGQAKIAGSIVEKLIIENPTLQLDKVAIILAEENILIPILSSLPASVGNLNITMGYSSKNNPAQILVAKLFKMHTKTLTRNKTSYLLYYKDVIDILTHPLIQPSVNASELLNEIVRNNLTYITHQKLLALNPNPSEIFLLLFQKWELGTIEILETISNLLQIIKTSISNDHEQDKIAKAFLYSIFKVINKLINYFSNHPEINKIEIVYSIYKQIVDLAEVSFEGEPLRGLQIMGVLESRLLDFDTVIITSMNEGNFPAGKAMNSFIPYDVKRELGLPTYKEKDAVYTYHFYHLLQRAKNIYLIYNTESEGINAGEKSRFITQLEVEKQIKHLQTHEIYNATLPEKAYIPIVIFKTESIITRLAELAKKGFSPSALTSYIRNPIDLYMQKILCINEAEEVEENIALNTLGTIIHQTLEVLYTPFIGKFLTESDIQSCISNLNTEVLKQFKLVYKEGEITKGKNLLAFEVAKRNIYNFLNVELEDIKNGQAIKILYLEKSCERVLTHASLPFPIKIAGKVDRIEQREGKIRIIDYKTGKVEKANVALKSWNGLTQDIKNDKIIQILAYAFMFEHESNNDDVEAGIISFKNLKSGFLPFTFKIGKEEKSIIDKEILDLYMEQIVLLLSEILDSTRAFEEKIQN